MPVNYVARKCNQCAGKLEYIKANKTWKCLYCGAEIERTEQYDGLFTIKNVVRQVLLDVSYRRLDNAEKNLIECEKIDSRYIGTIIAKIAYQMILAITPGAVPQPEISNLFTQIKRNYEVLLSIDTKVSGDEEALYEFFDNSDVFATLVLIYDTLNDSDRCTYVSALLNASEVYAKEPNKNLLSFALKKENYSLVDDLMSNTNNVDPVFALSELLIKYPDNNGKITNVLNLLSSQNFEPDVKKVIENYITTSGDSVHTKGLIVSASYGAQIRVSLEAVIANVLEGADFEGVKDVLNSICLVKLGDEDVSKLIDFAATAKDAAIAVCVLETLKSSGQYVVLQSKHLLSVLSGEHLSSSEKIEVVDTMHNCGIDAKSMEAVISSYLCFNDDSIRMRLEIVPSLLGKVSVIATSTIEKYILSVYTDGEMKTEIVKQIFALDLNLSFFNDLLAKYISSSSDPVAVKKDLISFFVEKGLKLDPVSMSNYICNSNDLADEKIDLIKNLINNGTHLRPDTVNAYLEGIPPRSFEPGLFALILHSASGVSENALCNYLLNCADKPSSKSDNFKQLSQQCQSSLADIMCGAVFNGQNIRGSILHIYVLTSSDSVEVAGEIVNFLSGLKIKPNAEINSSSMGGMKFKKFVSANKGQLSPVSLKMCEQLKMIWGVFEKSSHSSNTPQPSWSARRLGYGQNNRTCKWSFYWTLYRRG